MSGDQQAAPFLPFGEALAVAQSLGLTSEKEWRAWSEGTLRPPTVPADPGTIYKDAGWQGWGHWLGRGGTKKASKFAPFGQALAFARSLTLASANEWFEWSKEGLRPPNVPATPHKVYKNAGWQGWGHWLGTGNVSLRPAASALGMARSSGSSKFLPFAEALAVARRLGPASAKQWRVWSREGRRPPNIPSDPHRAYGDCGWQGWGHWLGTGNIPCGAEKILPFDEALAVARSLGLASAKEWTRWSKEGLCPANMSSHPCRAYKNSGWQGWGHWLGTGTQPTNAKSFLPFDQALVVARNLGLTSTSEWKAWKQKGLRPANMPAEPHVVYKDHGWEGWVHWLGGHNFKTKQFLPFKDALAEARALGLGSLKAWRAWCKEGMRPPNVPSGPNVVYKDHGWQGWGHWLGTGITRNTTPALPFAEALAYARSLGMTSTIVWRAWCKEGKRPPNVPAAPNMVYKDAGWQGWGHWYASRAVQLRPKRWSIRFRLAPRAYTPLVRTCGEPN